MRDPTAFRPCALTIDAGCRAALDERRRAQDVIDADAQVLGEGQLAIVPVVKILVLGSMRRSVSCSPKDISAAKRLRAS